MAQNTLHDISPEKSHHQLTTQAESVDESQRQPEQRKDLKLDLGRLARRSDPKNSRISKITLRKNSVRRRIAPPEEQPRNKKNYSAKKMRMGLPPKPSTSSN